MIGRKVICIDSKYSEGQLDWFSKNNVMFPSKGETYTIRSTVQNSDKIFIRLKEIRNQPVEMLPKLIIEPSFSLKHFQFLE